MNFTFRRLCADDLDAAVVNASTKTAMISGFFTPETSGETIVLGIQEAIDGSELFLNDRKVIDNGGQHGIVKKMKTIFLEPGFYRFHVRYFDVGGGAAFSLKWKMPNAHETVIPLSQFYHEVANRDINALMLTSLIPCKLSQKTQ